MNCALTVNDLIDAYLTDPDSNYHGLRFVTKEGYKRLLARIRQDMGARVIASIKIREIKQQHDAWSAGGHVSMAHGLITMLRVIISFGAALLENEDCNRIRPLLSKMNFPNGKPRTVWLEGEQATDVRDYATFHLYYAVALGQALQQDCAFRQKDVIGEWVPLDDPMPSTIINAKGDRKWVRGITREEIEGPEEDLVLRHQTSKRGQILTFHLKNCPSVMEEWFSAPPSGPLVVDPETRLPYEGWKYRRIWRRMATMAGIPKKIWNMDSRAGRITGVIDAGASLEDARKLAGHENQHTTSRYSRDAESAINRSLKAALEKGETYQEFAKKKWDKEE